MINWNLKQSVFQCFVKASLFTKNGCASDFRSVLDIKERILYTKLVHWTCNTTSRWMAGKQQVLGIFLHKFNGWWITNNLNECALCVFLSFLLRTYKIVGRAKIWTFFCDKVFSILYLGHVENWSETQCFHVGSQRFAHCLLSGKIWIFRISPITIQFCRENRQFLVFWSLS